MFNAEHVQVELDPEVQCLGDVWDGAFYPDLVAGSVKYPLLAAVKAGAFRGTLCSPRGVHMAIGVPEIYGTVRLWIGGGDGLQGVQFCRELDGVGRQTCVGGDVHTEIGQNQGAHFEDDGTKRDLDNFGHDISDDIRH